jgi:hypothetical protein
MSNPVPDTQPDPDEVLQHEETPMRMESVPVVVEGPIIARDAPSVAAAYFTEYVGTTPVQILGVDSRRRRAVISNVGGSAYYGNSQTGVDAGTNLRNSPALKIGDNQIFELRNIDELWVKAESGNVSVGVAVESWTR